MAKIAVAFLLISAALSQSCDEGYYQGRNNDCLPCSGLDETCDCMYEIGCVCHWPNEYVLGKCVCPFGFTVANGLCDCSVNDICTDMTDKCWRGFYPGATGCMKCHDDCLECTGPNVNDCTACWEGEPDVGTCRNYLDDFLAQEGKSDLSDSDVKAWLDGLTSEEIDAKMGEDEYDDFIEVLEWEYDRKKWEQFADKDDSDDRDDRDDNDDTAVETAESTALDADDADDNGGSDDSDDRDERGGRGDRDDRDDSDDTIEADVVVGTNEDTELDEQDDGDDRGGRGDRDDRDDGDDSEEDDLTVGTTEAEVVDDRDDSDDNDEDSDDKATQIGSILSEDKDDSDDRDDRRRGDRDDRREWRRDRDDRDDYEEKLEDIYDDRVWGGSGKYGDDADDDKDDGGEGRGGPSCGTGCRVAITGAIIFVAVAIVVSTCYCYHKGNKGQRGPQIPPPLAMDRAGLGSFGNEKVSPATPDNEYGEIIKPRPIYDPHVPMFGNSSAAPQQPVLYPNPSAPQPDVAYSSPPIYQARQASPDTSMEMEARNANN